MTTSAFVLAVLAAGNTLDARRLAKLVPDGGATAVDVLTALRFDAETAREFALRVADDSVTAAQVLRACAIDQRTARWLATATGVATQDDVERALAMGDYITARRLSYRETTRVETEN